MKTKKLVLSVLAVLGLGFFGINNAFATTWYVRDGGGTASQCTGTTNAVYPGTGTGQPCAFNNPMTALGYCNGNEGSGAPCNVAGFVKAGDTLSINGDSDINAGQQALYSIGYNTSISPSCISSQAYYCQMAPVPGGSSGAPTIITGTGTHKPQLYGVNRTQQLMWAPNNYVTLQWLELTTHDSCAYSDPVGGCPSPHAYDDGLLLGGTGLTLTDIYIHGFARFGVLVTANLGSATFTRLYAIGNGFGGFSIGNDTASSVTGTLTFNQPIVEWNGCVEKYPMSPGVDNPANYKDCYGQASGGYGDGLAFGPSGNLTAGNWVVIGPGSISFNTQDGLDTLHGNGNGTISIDKMRFEGNAGQQIKANGANFNLTNSIVVGDCGWWNGAAQSASGAMKLGDVCRANGDAILFNVTNGSTTNIFNNTILSNGSVVAESTDGETTGCNSSTAINFKNNIVYGGYSWGDDTSFNGSGGNALTTYIYNDGSNGNGLGTCGSLVWNEDYNIVYNTKNNNQNCVGTHDKCGTNPSFASSMPMGTSGGAANTFYQGNQAVTLLSLGSSSAAIASGVAGLTYWNNGNDYHNVTRTSPPSKGGLEASSCAASSYGCFYNSDCCGEVCSNLVCGSSTPQPVVSITSPIAGNSFITGANVTISATASEAGGTISNISIYNGSTLLGSNSTSPYNYVMSNAAVGTYNLTAIATDANGSSTTSSPVSITVTTNPVLPSLPVVTITSPASGSNYTAGSNVTVTTTASETNGTISNISLYNGSGILLGSSSNSSFNYVDNNMAAGGYSFYAIATDINGTSTTSSTLTITVTAPSVPVVAITSPVNASTFNKGANITVSASASETNGTIAQVSFYNGASLLGTSTTAPYSYTWTNVSLTSYVLTAVATDTNGVSTTSSPVIITLAAATSSEVAITSPANGSNVTAGSTVTITASASETNGTISQVQFYNGTTLLGTSTTSPYSFSWTNVAAGTYTLTAQATDANGVSTTSSVVSITVTASLAPVVAITSPVNGSSVTVGSNLSITAAASETNGTISKVAFYNGSTLLGTSKRSPYSYMWRSMTAGSYSISAKAYDRTNNTAMSPAVVVTVTDAAVTPSITAQPVSMTVTAPATATFNVAASGTPAPTYQWMQSVNGGTFTNISGATSASYTTPATSTANSGIQYECVVTNASGSVISNAATLTVNPTPIAVSITSQPVSMTVTAPATATFNVAASGTPAPTYQWMQSVNGGAFTNISGATSASYTTPATSTANSGIQYECVVTNASGSVISNAATLTVTPTPIAVSITSQPVSMTVTAPATATFSVAASGTPAPTYQWMQSVNGGAFTNISGATSASYTTPATSTANSGIQYECVVTNASGSVISNAATLTVTPTPIAVSITSQPVSMTVTAPATATFSVAASGTPAPTYQWMQSVNGGAFTNISGATSASYTTPATSTANSGIQYECVVTNASGSVISNAATLTVNPTPLAVSITSQPVSMTVTAPATATFSVAASGTPAPTYQWMQSVNGGAFTNISGATSASYTTPATSTANSGIQYECVVTNASGSVISNAATLTVSSLPVVMITSPADGSTFTKGANITVTASASETNGTIAQVSFYNGTGLLGTSTTAPYSYTWTNGSLTSYTVTAVATDNKGVSTTSSPVTITLASASLPVAAITSPADGSDLTTGSTLTITASASETNGSIAQVQFYNGSSLLGTDNSAPYTFNWTNVPAGNYSLTVKVTDASGVSVTSSAVTVTVADVPVAPSITAQPVSMTVTAPATETFSVAASGTPAPTYQWMQSVNGGAFTNISGATSASYTTPATSTANSGIQYECVVTNASGSVISNAATLTVNPTPLAVSITSQPVSMTVTAPATATFSVAASGTPAPTYQWMQSVNGGAFTNISVATSASYTTPATSTANSGIQYECVVTNASGSVISNAATLTVSSLPVVMITSPADGSTFTKGANITVTASASETNGTIAQVSFYNGTGLLGTSTTAPYSYTWTNGSLTSYTVTAVATDNKGVSTTSSPVTITLASASLPVAAITSPADGSDLTTGSTLTITASASETNGSIAQVQFYNGSSLLGTDNSAPYTFNWTNVPAGNYSLTVKVTDASGVSVTSSAVTVTVADVPVVPIITVQPMSITVRAPSRATFTVSTGTSVDTVGTSASSTISLSYQWMKSVNGGVFTSINGATSASYTTPETTAANSGTQYECVISTASGSVTSHAAVLTVITTNVISL